MKYLLYVLLIAITFAPSSVQAQAKSDLSSQAKNPASPVGVTIHQEIDFTVSPQKIYEALLDTKQFNEFSAMPAKIDPAVGGAFSVFDGHIIGRNLELVPNQRIVQAWRVVDWPAGVYSIAKFEFTAKGSGTHLVFDHTGFPEKLRDHLAEGWQSHYWDLLTKYFH